MAASEVHEVKKTEPETVEGGGTEEKKPDTEQFTVDREKVPINGSIIMIIYYCN